MGGSPATTTTHCGVGVGSYVGGTATLGGSCGTTTTPGTPPVLVPRQIQIGTKQVKNQAIADKIAKLEAEAAQAEKESADDTKRGMKLTWKAIGLFADWMTTREEAANAAGQAAQAVGYAAEEKGRAEHLSQVAAADEAAAARAEAEYNRLKGIYEAELRKSKPHPKQPEHLKNPPAPKDPDNPGTPPAPNLPVHNVTPPADQGPDVQQTPQAPPLPTTTTTPPAYQGPVIDAASPNGPTPAHIATTADVSSATGEAFFWSGIPEPVATGLAQALGSNTLEGLLRDRGIDMPDWGIGTEDVKEAWYIVSARYAAAASGEVRVMAAATVRRDSVWNLLEKPTLMDNPAVTRITRIDPATGDTKTIFVR